VFSSRERDESEGREKGKGLQCKCGRGHKLRQY